MTVCPAPDQGSSTTNIPHLPRVATTEEGPQLASGSDKAPQPDPSSAHSTEASQPIPTGGVQALGAQLLKS